MIVLDTNIISELMRPEPERLVIAWLDQQPAVSIWTSSICVFEVRMGLSQMPQGQRRRGLELRFEGLLQEDLAGRVLPFDTGAADMAAEIAGRIRLMGKPIELRDLLIAGTVGANRSVLASRNIKHFAHTGLRLVNPWEPGAQG